MIPTPPKRISGPYGVIFATLQSHLLSMREAAEEFIVAELHTLFSAHPELHSYQQSNGQWGFYNFYKIQIHRFDDGTSALDTTIAQIHDDWGYTLELANNFLVIHRDGTTMKLRSGNGS